MSRRRAQIRVAKRDGSLGEALPDATNVQYLDSSSDIGTVKFDYPKNGRNRDLLAPLVELALLVDGEELPNGRFRIDQDDTQQVTEQGRFVTWNGLTLIGRLDEALVLPETDKHAHEDVLTNHERDLLKEARKEWYEQAVKDAVKAAKEKARAHNAEVRGGSGGIGSGDANRIGQRAIAWGRAQITNPSQSWDHRCQSFVRQCYGFDGIYDTAIAAWQGGRKRTRHNSNPDEMPAGVPVYYGPNHVVLSTGNGFCLTSDALRVGQIDEVKIISLANGAIWGLNLLGWSPDESGHVIYP